MGNLIPIALALPFAAVGVWRLLQTGPTLGDGFAWIVAMPVVGWLAVNLFGHFENGAMRDAMRARLVKENVDLGDSRTFVGFARPGRSGLLDPHEDVGFLVMRTDELEFVGETHRVCVPRSAVVRIRFRPNIHTWVGLGRWVSVEGTLEDTPIRLLVEPRERSTLLGNLMVSGTLRNRLRAWLEKDGPGV